MAKSQPAGSLLADYSVNGLFDEMFGRDGDVFSHYEKLHTAFGGLAPDNRAAFLAIRDGTAAWLAQEHIPHAIPEALPGQLYADASHPLTEGYRLMAKRLLAGPAFRQWLTK